MNLMLNQQLPMNPPDEMTLTITLNAIRIQSCESTAATDDPRVVAEAPNANVDCASPSDEPIVTAAIASNSSNDLNPIG
jgi:hypothetical protein